MPQYFTMPSMAFSSAFGTYFLTSAVQFSAISILLSAVPWSMLPDRARITVSPLFGNSDSLRASRAGAGSTYAQEDSGYLRDAQSRRGGFFRCLFGGSR